MNSAKKCGSFGFGRTLQAPPGPLPRSNGIMFQDQGSKGSISHATSPEHNANAQVHLRFLCGKGLLFLKGLLVENSVCTGCPLRRRLHFPQRSLCRNISLGSMCVGLSWTNFRSTPVGFRDAGAGEEPKAPSLRIRAKEVYTHCGVPRCWGRG